jgi:hypothetical protein
MFSSLYQLKDHLKPFQMVFLFHMFIMFLTSCSLPQVIDPQHQFIDPCRKLLLFYTRIPRILCLRQMHFLFSLDQVFGIHCLTRWESSHQKREVDPLVFRCKLFIIFVNF